MEDILNTETVCAEGRHMHAGFLGELRIHSKVLLVIDSTKPSVFDKVLSLPHNVLH